MLRARRGQREPIVDDQQLQLLQEHYFLRAADVVRDVLVVFGRVAVQLDAGHSVQYLPVHSHRVDGHQARL